jgi:hypothetical protein
MLLQASPLEVCQRAENILHEVQSGDLIPGTEMLAQWENELGQVGVLLEAAYNFLTEKPKLSDNSALCEVLLRIRNRTETLKIQFEHGSNFCMGLLQLRLGTGYSERGLPVLMPTEARSTFEG